MRQRHQPYASCLLSTVSAQPAASKKRLKANLRTTSPYWILQTWDTSTCSHFSMLSPQFAQAPLSRGGACSECRARKQRCDGNRPRCGRCKSQERTCEFPGALSRLKAKERLEQRVIELELQIAHLASTHDKAPISHRIFEQFRHFGVLPKKKTNSPLPFVLAYPWVLPLPNVSLVQNLSISHHGEGSGSSAEFIPRTVIDQLFNGWRPELGVSTEQSLCLYVQYNWCLTIKRL